MLRKHRGSPYAIGWVNILAAPTRHLEFHAGACDKLRGKSGPPQDAYPIITQGEPIGTTSHIIP